MRQMKDPIVVICILTSIALVGIIVHQKLSFQDFRLSSQEFSSVQKKSTHKKKHFRSHAVYQPKSQHDKSTNSGQSDSKVTFKSKGLNNSAYLETIYESRRQKMIEICKKYKMKNWKSTDDIFDTILCFSSNKVSGYFIGFSKAPGMD